MARLHPLLVKCFSAANIDTDNLSSSRGIVTDPQTGQQYYTKTGHNVAQMAGEVASLRAMGRTAPKGLVPQVIGFQVEGNENSREAGMVSQYFDLGRSVNQKQLGLDLAQMHRGDPEQAGEHKGRYGFPVPSHCGVTEQDNTWEQDWRTFFENRRLGDMVQRIGDPQISAQWEKLRERAIPLLLENISPAPTPVIIHGDLWSGNVGTDKATGNPVIFDPSSVYGHNEYELGICNMFGGFSPAFFDAYHSVHPRSSPHYAERQKLYELYHHLNHTLMFGGGYKSGALSIMKSLIDFADRQ